MISTSSRARLNGTARRAAAVALLAVTLPAAAFAQDCGNSGGGFDSWLERFKGKAAAQGISQGAISSALSGVTYDPTVVRLDRSQKSFKLSLNDFCDRSSRTTVGS